MSNNQSNNQLTNQLTNQQFDPNYVYDKWNDIQKYSANNIYCYSFIRHPGYFIKGYYKIDNKIMRYKTLKEAKYYASVYRTCTGITQDFYLGKLCFTLRSADKVSWNEEHNPKCASWVKRLITEEEHEDLQSDLPVHHTDELDTHARICNYTFDKDKSCNFPVYN